MTKRLNVKKVQQLKLYYCFLALVCDIHISIICKITFADLIFKFTNLNPY